MGSDLSRARFSAEEMARFRSRLGDCVRALARLIERPGFGGGPVSLGAELELCLVDEHGGPAMVNVDVLGRALDERVAVELDRFNLEINANPVVAEGAPFSAIAAELREAVGVIRRAAARSGARVAAIGILPTLQLAQLQSSVMTDVTRYRALSAALRRMRGGRPFAIDIDGPEPFTGTCDDVTLEGATTSLQVHLKVAPGDIARVYNAAQLATAPVLAACANSPIFGGHVLWDETRVALFKQAVDSRVDRAARDAPPARVSFGDDWIDAPVSWFADTVALHDPLLPELHEQDPLAIVDAGGVPALRELRLHSGTVWTWNRLVYDGGDGGHLRIELRALPAGPTVVDMAANAAFLVGLALGLAPRADEIAAAFPFSAAHANFYRAAKYGLDAELLWPGDGGGVDTRGAAELARSLIPTARRGLVSAGVDAGEAHSLLRIIGERIDSGITGSRWQRAELARLEQSRSRRDALAALVERYLERCHGQTPIHRWDAEGA